MLCGEEHKRHAFLRHSLYGGSRYFLFFNSGLYEFHLTHDFFRLAPLGNPVFPEKCDFFRPENSPAPFSGGGKHPKSKKKLALFNVHKKNSQCADVRFNVRRKAVSVRTLNI